MGRVDPDPLMIRVTVELLSAGTRRTTVLGVALISNDGTGTPESGNYDVEVSKADGRGVWKRGRVEGFARNLLGAWDLLFHALAPIIGYRIVAAHDEAQKLVDVVPVETRSHGKAETVVLADALEARQDPVTGEILYFPRGD